MDLLIGPVYKSAHGHIVTLQITKDSPTNLGRKVADPLTAKYRCKSATVVNVEDSKGNPVTEINSDYDEKFIYKVGMTITVNEYDEGADKYKICAPGIHFFLSKKRASFYRKSYINYTGPYFDWTDDGALYVKGSYVDGILKETKLCNNGILHGYCKTWYDDGKLHEHKIYCHGKLHGDAQSWHPNGRIMEIKRYYNDVLCGDCNVLYDDGKQHARKFYSYGKLHGESYSWFPNGQMMEMETYNKGVLHGKCKYCDDDGTVLYECVYVDGILHGKYTMWLGPGITQEFNYVNGLAL